MFSRSKVNQLVLSDIMRKAFELSSYEREKKISLLTAVFVAVVSMLNLFAFKLVETSIFGFRLRYSVAAYLYSLTFPCTDVVTNVVGPWRAQRIVFYGLGASIFVVLFSSFAVWHPYPEFWSDDQFYYKKVIGFAPRAAAAGLFVYSVTQSLDILFLRKLHQTHFAGKNYAFQALGSTIPSQFIDSLFFLPLAFLGTEKFPLNQEGYTNIVGAIFATWFIKVAITIAVLPLGMWLRKWIGYTNQEQKSDEAYAKEILMSEKAQVDASRVTP